MDGQGERVVKEVVTIGRRVKVVMVSKAGGEDGYPRSGW